MGERCPIHTEVLIRSTRPALDPERFGLMISTDQRPALPLGGSSPTGAEVVASAVAAGWTVAHTTGGAHLTLTKTNIKPTDRSVFSPGDTITALVPIDDLAAPVPRTLIARLLGAGLAIPPRSKSGDGTRSARCWVTNWVTTPAGQGWTAADHDGPFTQVTTFRPQVTELPRMPGSQGVRGSNPLSSTHSHHRKHYSVVKGQ